MSKSVMFTLGVTICSLYVIGIVGLFAYADYLSIGPAISKGSAPLSYSALIDLTNIKSPNNDSAPSSPPVLTPSQPNASIDISLSQTLIRKHFEFVSWDGRNGVLTLNKWLALHPERVVVSFTCDDRGCLIHYCSSGPLAHQKFCLLSDYRANLSNVHLLNSLEVLDSSSKRISCISKFDSLIIYVEVSHD